MQADRVLDSTRVYCMPCAALHKASIVRSGNRVEGLVDCPRGARRVTLSSDADMFLTLRGRCRGPVGHDFHTEGGHLVNLVNITNHCNMKCPVCYAASGPEAEPSFLPVDEVVERANAAKRRGAKVVTLAGGEPTLHPELAQIIRRIRRAGVRVVLPTNGLALSEDPALARRLEEAGLWKVNVQFDTLDPEVRGAMRGRRSVEGQVRVMREVVRAGLSLGTITTVTGLNLHELGDLIRVGLGLGPGLNSMIFQAAAPVGRYELEPTDVVDKEQVVRAILESGAIPGATLEHVWPLPFFAPWGLRVHPDCAVNIFLRVDRGRTELVGDVVDMERLYSRMAHSTAGRSWWARNAIPLAYLLGACRKGGRLRLVRDALKYFDTKRSRGFLVIGVGAYVPEAFWDLERVTNCGSAVMTATGPVSPCVWYSGAKNLLHN